MILQGIAARGLRGQASSPQAASVGKLAGAMGQAGTVSMRRYQKMDQAYGMVRRKVKRGVRKQTVSGPATTASFHPKGTFHCYEMGSGLFFPCGTDSGLLHPYGTA